MNITSRFKTVTQDTGYGSFPSPQINKYYFIMIQKEIVWLFVKDWDNFVKNKKQERTPWNPLNFPSEYGNVDVRNSPFLGVLNSFAELQLNVGILTEREFRIPGAIQRKNQTEPKCG